MQCASSTVTIEMSAPAAKLRNTGLSSRSGAT